MKKNKSSTGIIILSIFIILVAALAYLYNSKMFERNIPSIKLDAQINWNLKTPIAVNISDESGIKFVRATLSDGKNSIVLFNKQFAPMPNEYLLEIEFPRTGFISNKKTFTLEVEVVDTSKWNFFAGNSINQKALLHVDTQKPQLYTVNNSYKIIKGGVATVVFKAEDENLVDLYIETNFGKKFYPTPFYKDNYYVSLLAWPVDEKSFDATIIAKDKAGNISKNHIGFYLKDKKYRVSSIELKDNFLDGKIADLVDESENKMVAEGKIEKFKFVNEALRKTNEDLIEKITTQTPQNRVNSFGLSPFYPLKNAAAVASFGDHRYYKYQNSQVSESYHLGLDLASTAMADIKASNAGKVVYAKYNGIYGDNIIISHGLGVFSLYGHCSSFLITEGQEVKKDQIIAKTGRTGLALGDHLHFGIIVQGIEVRPEEWMDKDWMKESIFTILETSKKIIDR